MVKYLPIMQEDLDLIPGSGRSPGEGEGYPLLYSGLESSMDRGAWWATIHEVTKLDMTEKLTLSLVSIETTVFWCSPILEGDAT